ncbi:MAG: CotH kinase family protein [Pirellulaceae bacterium]
MSQLRRTTQTNPCLEHLEARRLLAADLIAHWNASDLAAQLADGQSSEIWLDRIAEIPANQDGQPSVQPHALNQHATVRFDNPSSFDRYVVRTTDNPLTGLRNFSVSVVFATASDELSNVTDQWYFQSGIVDANGFGLVNDWGIAINQLGQVSAGIGNPARTVTSANSPLTDGLAHHVILVRSGELMMLYVDGQMTTQTDVSDRPLDAREIRFGTGGVPYVGDIADIRFFDDALTRQEAQMLSQQLQTQYYNSPPTAQPDSFFSMEDQTLVVDAATGVLSNDQDSEGDSLTAVLIQETSHGRVTLRPDGSFEYVPDANFYGTDSFTYQAIDQQQLPSPVSASVTTVTIHVSPAFDPLIVQPDRYVAVTNTPLVVDASSGLATNDQNPDREPLTFGLQSAPTAGQLALDTNGQFEYFPQDNFSGEVSFHYQVSTASGQSYVSTATILVLPQPILISEFVAANRTTLDDDNGESSDWIELFHFGSNPISLDGWHLTDDPDRLDRWTFPPTVLSPGETLVVFASGRDRRDSQPLHTNFRLSSAGEYLALVEPNGQTVIHQFAPEFPAQFSDISYGLVQHQDIMLPRLEYNYLTAASPGTMETQAPAALGPFIQDVQISPPTPTVTDDVLIQASIKDVGSTTSNVTLVYRLMYGPEQRLTMVDDGSVAGDVPNDGVYSARVTSSVLNQLEPAAVRTGQMFRYRIEATSAEQHVSHSPFVPNMDSPRDYDEYYGTVLADPQIQTPLDVLHWFVPDPNWHKTGNGNNTRWSPASVYYAGRFYDNLMVRVRGQSTVNWDKPKFKFEFNPGRPFWYSDTLPAVDEFNLQSHFVEKGATSYMGENLAFGFLQAAGVPAPHTQHFHVRQNGRFYSLASLIEQVDETFLERHSYDATNPMYKANSSSAQSTLAVGPNRTNYQKVTRQNEPFDDLIEFTNGINGQIPNVDRSSYLFDYVDLPQVINNMAANTILTNHDRLTKNYYVYWDQSGTHMWNMFPWDMDQAFALRTDENFASILYGDSEHPQATGQPIYQNHLLDAILDTPATRAMYLRRLRTLYDDFLAAGYFEQQIEAYRLQIEQDAAADHAIWNAGTLDAGIDRLHYNLDFRRRQLAADPLLPASQSTYTDSIVLDQDAESVWWVPTDNSLDDRWFAPDFDADHWLPAEGGVGYERGTGYEPFLGTMYGSLDRTLPIRLDDWMDRNGDGDPDGTSVYVRYEFDLSEFQAIDRLLLRARFDDGIVAYLNGQEVAKSGVVGEGWDAVALRNNEADQSFTQFDLTPLLTTGQLTLQPGRNVLAIQVVNRQANSPDLLVQPQLLVGQRSQPTFDVVFGAFSDAQDVARSSICELTIMNPLP